MEEKPAIFSPDPKHPQIPVDSENFSEVSLDSKPEPGSGDSGQPSFYNPLEGLDSVTDLQQLQQQDQPRSDSADHSLRSDLSASFAQLPNVASTVFSTFSRVIKGGSSANLDEQPSNSEPYTSSQLSDLQQPSVPKSTLDDLYDLQYSQQHQSIGQTSGQQHAPVPTFFSPTDPPLSSPSGPPPLFSGSNTFRLGGQKKKVYAGIPGLNTTAAVPVPQLPQTDSEVIAGSSVPPLPTLQPPFNYQSQPVYQSIPNQQATGENYFDLNQQSEQFDPAPVQSAQSKFSLSSFIPSAATSLLNKVPSVKDFAQNIKETINPSYEPQNTQIYEPQHAAGYFTVESTSQNQQQETHQQQQVPSFNSYNFNTAPFAQSNQGIVQQVPDSTPSLLSSTITQSKSEEIKAQTIETFAPPPTFFNPISVPSIPKGHNLKSSSGNPYSNTRFGKSAIYANPSLIPVAGQTPVIPNTVEPGVYRPNSEQGFEPTSANYFNPLHQTLPPQPSTSTLSQEEPAVTLPPASNISTPTPPKSEIPLQVSSGFLSFPPTDTNQPLSKNLSTVTGNDFSTDQNSPSVEQQQITETITAPPPTSQLFGPPPTVSNAPALTGLNPYKQQKTDKPVSKPQVANFSFFNPSANDYAKVAGDQPIQVLNPNQQPEIQSQSLSASVASFFSPQEEPQAPGFKQEYIQPALTNELISKSEAETFIPSQTDNTKVSLEQTTENNIIQESDQVDQPKIVAEVTEETKPVASFFSDLPTSYPPPLESVNKNQQPNKFVTPPEQSTLPSRSPFQAFFASTEQSSFDSVISNASSSTWDSSSGAHQIQASPQKQEASKPTPHSAQPNLGLTPLFDTFTHNQHRSDQQNNFINIVQQTENLSIDKDSNANPIEAAQPHHQESQPTVQSLFDNYQQTSSTNIDPFSSNQSRPDNQDSRVINNNTYNNSADSVPRFTPVNFFIETPNTSNTPDQANSNSIASFFDNPTQTQKGSSNQLADFFNQQPAFQQQNYIQPQDVLSQQTLISRDLHLQEQQQQQQQQSGVTTSQLSFTHGFVTADIAATESFSSFRSESVSELREDFIDYDELPEEIMADELDAGKDIKYRPAYYHWFYQTQQDGKMIWQPFSMNDSLILEDEFKKDTDAQIVHTNGGRFDVVIPERKRKPVYWKGEGTEVRRCSWFYKALDSRFVPYEENIADKLEEEYKTAALNGEWHKKIPLPNGETVVFHGPSVIVHFLQSQNSDSWGSSAQPNNRPRVVKRGIEEFSIEDGEPEQIDHLLFMVHGIGKACDLKFRTIEEAVDEFRSIALQLVQSHYRTSCDLGSVGRVEVLPVSWHAELHSAEIGIDDKIKAITLESIPKLRQFANETLLDILFYSSPVFAQHIMDFVGHTMNRVFTTFRKRNPKFCGGVSVGGHSLGSLILFDLLCHQNPNLETENMEDPDGGPGATTSSSSNSDQHLPKTVNYTMGQAGAGQPFINYPQLIFRPKKFFALGSPISMFVTVRGIDKLGLDFKLPTCDGFYNIFHPFDPVAYRCEPLINPNLINVKPVVIAHHKGRKRMHLELKETMARVGADIKQRILFTFKNTMQAVYSLTTKQPQPDPTMIEQEVDKVLEDQLNMDTVNDRKRSDSMSTTAGSDVDTGETDQPLGLLNKSRRVDYVLQEAPLEFFNEYLFALTSHVCYWESADTILFMMKEIYSAMGIQTDSRIPQNSLTIERPSTSNASP